MPKANDKGFLERTFDGGPATRRGCLITSTVLILGSLLLLVQCSYKMTMERIAETKQAKIDAKIEAEKEAAEKAERKRKGFHCLSGWDGSQPDLVEQTKLVLRDPDSFQHIETIVWPNVNGQHRVVMAFRSRNGFGGMMPGKAVATMSNAGCSVRVENIE